MSWTESGMKFLGFLKKSSSAPIARERLQILLAHERRGADQPELLNLLREEILAVIAKHLQFDREKVLIKLDRGRSVCTLDVDIELPNSFDAASEAI